MGAKEGLIGGHIMIKVIGHGVGAKLQMKLNGENEEEKDLCATIIETADLAGKVLGNDPTLRASTRGGKKVRVYRKTPQGDQEIATLTPKEILNISTEMDLGEPEDTERVLTIYREPVSGIPKLALELRINLRQDTVDQVWTGVEDRLATLENGDTRQEAVQKVMEQTIMKLNDLQRSGELEEWARRGWVPMAKIDPPSHETGFHGFTWRQHEQADG